MPVISCTFGIVERKMTHFASVVVKRQGPERSRIGANGTTWTTSARSGLHFPRGVRDEPNGVNGGTQLLQANEAFFEASGPSSDSSASPKTSGPPQDAGDRPEG